MVSNLNLNDSKNSAKLGGILPRGVLALTLVFVSSAVPALAQTNLIANGTYTIASKNSGQVIDVTGASKTQGAYLDQWASSGNSDQQWKLNNLGNNYVSLINVNSGLAMEVYGASTADSALVDQWPYNSGKNQIWQVVSKGSGYYELINENSGQALDVNEDSTTEGAAIDQYAISGNANQLWAFTLVGGSSTCTPTAITPYIFANGAWDQESSASVASGSTVDLGPQPETGGSWSWTGPNGYTSASREIDSIPLTVGTDTYEATYTNASGCKSTQAFGITVTGGGSTSCGSTFLPVNGSCGYIKGANLAWLDGAYNTWLGEDPTEPSYGIAYNSTNMNAALAAMHSLGIKVVRVWIMEGDMGCTINGSDYVTGVTSTFWSNLDNAVQLAKNNDIALYLTINNGREDWLENPAQVQSFITNALIPLVNRYKGNSGVWAIDAMNEIDGTIAGNSGNYTSTGATWAQAQAYMKTVAAAIHNADSNRLVSTSTGWHTWTNLDMFKGLGLDFYDFHVYADNGYVPTASSLGMDKPIYMGESGQGTDEWSDSLQNTAEANFLSNTSSGGYAGLGIWDYGYDSGNESDIYQMLETNGSLRPVANTIKSFNP
jgi:hypothetical protein